MTRLTGIYSPRAVDFTTSYQVPVGIDLLTRHRSEYTI